MIRRFFAGLILIGLMAGLMGCASPNGRAEAEVRKIRLPMGYIPNIQYAPYYVAVEKGYFKEAGFEVEFDYSFETDGVALVGAGELPFAVASGEQVLLARANGVPVTQIVAWYQSYPISIISAKELNITSPADLKGRKIGVPGLFGATYIGAQALLFAGGLSAADVEFEAIGFNQVGAYASGQNDIVVGYAANEPVQLRAQGFELNEMRVADYAQLASNGILTSEKVVAEDPEMARAFIGAFLKGLKDTIENPDEAFALSAKHIPDFETLDQDVQKQVLATSIELWKAKRLGYADPQSWENMQNVLLNMGLIEKKMDLTKAFTNEFVP